MAQLYKRKYLPSHKDASKDGLVYEHRIQASKKLGRDLKKIEHVHHIDGNKYNNDEDNLMVFKTNSDHVAFHNGISHILDGDVYICPDKNVKKIICPICKINYMDRTSKSCSTCSNKNRRKVNRPTKEELIYLIKEYNFEQLGKKFGVTGNAIRQWCKLYKISYKKKEKC